jgi:hypothetical protein
MHTIKDNFKIYFSNVVINEFFLFFTIQYKDGLIDCADPECCSSEFSSTIFLKTFSFSNI